MSAIYKYGYLISMFTLNQPKDKSFDKSKFRNTPIFIYLFILSLYLSSLLAGKGRRR